MMVESANGHSDESANVILADIGRRYDIIALQGIRSVGPSSATSLVDQMNSMERSQAAGPQPNYRVLIDQAQSHVGSNPTQLAIIYDAAAVSLDNDRWYQVRDPEDILVHKPMVAWFETKQPSVCEPECLPGLALDTSDRYPVTRPLHRR